MNHCSGRGSGCGRDRRVYLNWTGQGAGQCPGEGTEVRKRTLWGTSFD